MPVTKTEGGLRPSVGTTPKKERTRMMSDRFDRFLPLAGVLAGLLFFVGLVLMRNDPSSETGPAQTFSYWQADHGRHQIVALLVAPLIALLLVFFGAGLRRRLARGGDAGHGSVAFGGALLGSAGFTLVGMLEGAMTNAAHEGERTTVYTLNQLHSYDWLAWNAAFAAMLLATGLGARRNAMLPAPLAWATIVIGASLLTPLGFFGFVLVPVWLIVVGLWLGRRDQLARALALAPITVCVVLLAGCGGSHSSAQTVTGVGGTASSATFDGATSPELLGA